MKAVHWIQVALMGVIGAVTAVEGSLSGSPLAVAKGLQAFCTGLLGVLGVVSKSAITAKTEQGS